MQQSHVKLCAEWGLSEGDLESALPAPEMLAYTRYVLDTGMRGDLLDLQVALAPCVIGYAEIAARLTNHPLAKSPNNPYREWIAEYAGEAYQQVSSRARDQIDNLGNRYATPTRQNELQATFKEATRLEIGFWDMGWNMK